MAFGFLLQKKWVVLKKDLNKQLAWKQQQKL